MSDIDDALAQLIQELTSDASLAEIEDPVAREKAKAGREKYLTAMLTVESLNKHVIERIKARDFVLTGDESHSSIQYYLKQAANIDKPKKYDFQDDDCHERDFIRSIKYMLPQLAFYGKPLDPDDVVRAIDGEGSVTVTGDGDVARCYDCTAKMQLTISGNKFHVSCEKECERNASFSVEVDFPTGEVVFADWPDRFSEIKDAGYLDDGDDGESINYIKGQRQRSETFARQGIYHHSVGNTCPTWYYNEATGQINIGGGTYDEETDETTVPEGFKDMGYFCTDLWWVTMLDKSRYDEMVSKLPVERSKRYYDKNVEIATIKPGRYRFTAIPRSREDDDGGALELFATAEYIGPCGDVPPVKFVTEDKVVLTPDQHLRLQAKKYPFMFSGQAEKMRLRAADQIFNVIGNGIRSKGEFLAYISERPEVEIPDSMPPVKDDESKKSGRDSVFVPYPNFQEQYSTVYVAGVKNIPTNWLEEAAWFYEESLKFFNGEHVGQYSNAFPAKTQKETDERIKQVQEVIDRHLAQGETPEELKVWLKNNYRLDYDGDLHACMSARWNENIKAIKKFITKTIKKIRTEVKRRETLAELTKRE